jgi:hypothetical protein
MHALIDPFVEFAFMRRALVGCFALSLGAPPVGVFLVLRRLSLMGDAMSHAILPGAAIGFLAAGLSLFSDALSPADGPAGTYLDMFPQQHRDPVGGAVVLTAPLLSRRLNRGLHGVPWRPLLVNESEQ